MIHSQFILLGKNDYCTEKTTFGVIIARIPAFHFVFSVINIIFNIPPSVNTSLIFQSTGITIVISP